MGGGNASSNIARVSRRDLQQEQKRLKMSKKLKYCCKRLSIAKHAHGLYYKDMQSFSCPTMGFFTLFGILMVLIFAGITIYNVQSKNYSNVQIFHGRIQIEDFDIHTFVNKTRLIV